MWDMRPFAPANRCTKVFTGHQHNFEQNLLKCDWSPDGSRVRGLGGGCLRKQSSWCSGCQGSLQGTQVGWLPQERHRGECNPGLCPSHIVVDMPSCAADSGECHGL